MLVTFTCPVWADITLFGDIAVRFIKIMGHTGTVPGALSAEDIPEALSRLNAYLDTLEEVGEEDGEDGANRVSLSKRAYPLIQLLEAARDNDCAVMWA